MRIISTTMTIGSRAFTARCEVRPKRIIPGLANARNRNGVRFVDFLTLFYGQIWNVTHNRLVSSGVHVKMEPSAAKL